MKEKFDFSKMSDEKKISLLNRFGVGIILIIALIVGITTSLKMGDINTKISQNEAKIVAIRDEMKKANEVKQPSVDEVKKIYASAEELGSLVASKQNEYKDVHSNQEDYENKIMSISDAIGKTFKEDTKNQTGRTPWFKPNDDTVSYSWSFLSNYSFDGTSLPVIWVCRDGKSILAYATATYDGEKNLFDNFQKTYTGVGSAYFKSETENRTMDEGLQSVIDSIRNATEDEDTKKLNEEYNKNIQDIHNAREKLKQEQQGGGN